MSTSTIPLIPTPGHSPSPLTLPHNSLTPLTTSPTPPPRPHFVIHTIHSFTLHSYYIQACMLSLTSTHCWHKISTIHITYLFTLYISSRAYFLFFKGENFEILFRRTAIASVGIIKLKNKVSPSPPLQISKKKSQKVHVLSLLTDTLKSVSCALLNWHATIVYTAWPILA